MNENLQLTLDRLQELGVLSDDQFAEIRKLIVKADKALVLSDFKLTRVEKERRATSILLEETIEELQQKQSAIEETNESLQQALHDLQSTQEQLIFSEKMASLGELTAGVAHEIQNPLNFVINFAEFSVELGEELAEEFNDLLHVIPLGDRISAVRSTLGDLVEIQQKIYQHGKRAEKIVRNMLQHSRDGSGEMEMVDINKMLDESVSLAYQGMIGNHQEFRCELDLQLADGLPEIQLVYQDISRVFLNLVSNAFYAMNEKRKQHRDSYEPKLEVRNHLNDDFIHIHLRDNGIGIPDEIKEKVFNPFFTTKPTGEGTGLGLSLSFDMIKAHNGTISVQSEIGEYTEFVLSLPAPSNTTNPAT